MLKTLAKISLEASEAIMQVYEAADFVVEQKEDDSPVTVADLKANDIITKRLKEHFDYPILSEEALVEYAQRKDWTRYWCVDPLDGTKSFVKHEDEFTVNIALIENRQPVASVLTLPVTQDVYVAAKGEGCFKNGQKIFNNSVRQGVQVIAATSRVHKTGCTQAMIERNHIIHTVAYSSSLKFGLLAEGKVDLHPRLGPTSEWDIAAGQIICEEAGCEIYQIPSREPMPYNKESYLNSNFMACRKGLAFEF